MSGLFTIRSYLLLMIAAIILPMMTLVAILAWDYGAAGRRTIEAERLDVVNNLMHLMDRDIQANEGFLAGVAASLAGPRIPETVVTSAMASGFSMRSLVRCLRNRQIALGRDNLADLLRQSALLAGSFHDGRFCWCGRRRL